MKKTTVIVSGCSGQLGQYMIKYLLENYPEHQIIGTIRHKSRDEDDFIFDKSKITFELMDLTDPVSIDNLIIKYKPDYFINTSANAFVAESWVVPVQQIEQNTIGVLYQLEAIKKHSPNTRYFNSGTSEEFACSNNDGKPQNENTLISPKSPYGCSKAASRYLVDVYRKSYNLYCVQGWTFNFESKLRSKKYLTGKVADGVARIYHAIINNQEFEPIFLGNIYSYRSWQHAADVADGIWRILNQDIYNKDLKPKYNGMPYRLPLHIKELAKEIKPYVLSESNTHNIKEFIELSFQRAGLEGEWTYNGEEKPENEVLKLKNGKTLVAIDPKFYRPLDVTFLYGDSALARNELGWLPKVKFNEIVNEMVEYHIKKQND
jgi:GDPmannose 4,6-dehydratase